MPEWIVDWAKSLTLWDALLFVIAAIATVQFIRKKAWRNVKEFARAVIRLDKVLEVVLQLPELTQSIHHETHTNNGSSIKDASVRTEKKVDTLIDQVAELIRWQGEHEQMSSEVVGRVKRLEDTQPPPPKE